VRWRTSLDRLVTKHGECFEVELETTVPGYDRDGVYYPFKLKNIRREGTLLVSVFRSGPDKVQTPDYESRIEAVRLNAIRRAFDKGILSFDRAPAPGQFVQINLTAADFEKQPKAAPQEIREFIYHMAYWLGYMGSSPDRYVVQFDGPIDLDYLGADADEVRRQAWRLEQSGELRKTEFPGVSGPTQKMIEEYESRWIEPTKALKDSTTPQETSRVSKRSEWQELKRLGGGGQSDVFLVRKPARKAERDNGISTLVEISGQSFDKERADRFSEAVWNLARPDAPEELAALKVFKTRAAGADAEEQALDRLRSEIHVLSQNRPGLPRLLDSNEEERWIVTEYFPGGTLEEHLLKYRGNAAGALRAFRYLVQTVASLHAEGIVHRDIKPANVFIGGEGRLILGDFGIVYLPNLHERLTVTGERVGPRDFIPLWGNLGARQQNVEPNFDVYMLGKLLWSMVDGRAALPRESHRDTEYDFDLTRTFPDDPQMHLVNSILDKSVVPRPRDCLSSAQELLPVIDNALKVIEHGGQLLTDGIARPCHVCGAGFYQPETFRHIRPEISEQGSFNLRFSIGNTTEQAFLSVSPAVCDNCGHVQFFKAFRR
jgi:serine/threonine protein kinase